MNTQFEKKQRLKWQCRRGMLEVDLFLNRYLSMSYDKSLPEDKAIFEAFLQENDQQLFLWLTQKEAAPARYENLVQQMLGGK